MSSLLNDLERNILAAMRESCVNPEAFSAQISTAAVLSRINTGAGFFTEILIDPSSVPVGAKIIGNVFANVSGLKNPMTFVLYLTNGHIAKLEGASIEDNTASVDFSKVIFNVI